MSGSDRELQQPVIPFAGVIAHPDIDPDRFKELFQLFPVDIDRTSPVIAFDHTSYYREEMGENLRRYWISFEDHWEEADLAARKETFVSFEEDVADRLTCSDRPVNVDPGYVKSNQVVLASTKYVDHRICIGYGMFAEVTLLYEDDEYQKLPWTYPDYTTETAQLFFGGLRDRYFREIDDS